MASVMAIESDLFGSYVERINLSVVMENKSILPCVEIFGISFCSKSGSRLLVEMRDDFRW
jgi:hypothetical protein